VPIKLPQVDVASGASGGATNPKKPIPRGDDDTEGVVDLAIVASLVAKAVIFIGRG